jgi:hypothetical protein
VCICVSYQEEGKEGGSVIVCGCSVRYSNGEPIQYIYTLTQQAAKKVKSPAPLYTTPFSGSKI